MLKISVNTLICIGAGQCVATAPDVFDQADDGVVRLFSGQPAAESWADVREAAARCPVSAITTAETDVPRSVGTASGEVRPLP